MFVSVLTAMAFSNVCIKHTELKNSTNPIQTFVANISDYGDLQLSPKVRYRTDDNNLHVIDMTKGACSPNCTYSARVEIDEPGRIRYTISSGDGYGHALWTPGVGMYGTFWMLPRTENWVTVEPIEDTKESLVDVNITVKSSAKNVQFVFADTQQTEKFDNNPCIENECKKQIRVDVGTRSKVDYYIETEDKTHFWPKDKPYETFNVIRPQEQSGANNALSGGAWAGIGVGIAIGTALLVYAIYSAVKRGQKGRKGGGEENRKLISGTQI